VINACGSFAADFQQKFMRQEPKVAKLTGILTTEPQPSKLAMPITRSKF
jgi:hypothetical protein